MAINGLIPTWWRAIDPAVAETREEEAVIASAVDHHERWSRKEGPAGGFPDDEPLHADYGLSVVHRKGRRLGSNDRRHGERYWAPARLDR